MCREMARKRLHDQHPHTEVEKGLARVGQSSTNTAYTVLRMCREMARKRLHDQHPHTEVEKGLARVAELHLDIKDLLENVLIDLGKKSSALLRFWMFWEFVL